MGRTLRQSNFEILRLIAIFLIVAFHYVYKAGWDMATMPLANRLVTAMFGMGGELGVNLFVLISGYFLVRGRFSWRKLALLLAEVMFYNYLSLFVVSGCDPAAFLSSVTVRDVFPTAFCNAYWFTTAYVLLYLFSPYLSQGIRALGRERHLRLACTAVVTWSVLPTMMGVFQDVNSTEAFLFYNRFVWMLVLFVVGSFISLYGEEVGWLRWSARRYLMVTAGLSALLALFILGVELFPEVAGALGIRSSWYFWPPNTVMELSLALSLFLAFRQMRVPALPAVNLLATTTLGIYLLHDGQMQTILWADVFSSASHASSRFLPAWIAGSALVIVVAGATIDLLRQQAERVVLRGGAWAWRRIRREGFPAEGTPAMSSCPAPGAEAPADGNTPRQGGRRAVPRRRERRDPRHARPHRDSPES